MKKQKRFGFVIYLFKVFIGAALFLFLLITVMGKEQRCSETGATVLSIKSADVSSGFLSSRSVCVYETDKGDVSTVCGYGAGDLVDVERKCVWVCNNKTGTLCERGVLS